MAIFVELWSFNIKKLISCEKALNFFSKDSKAKKESKNSKKILDSESIK
jgi:hypothetical protein